MLKARLDNVLLKLEKKEKETKTKSGIIIAQKNDNSNRQSIGTVVSVGEGRILSNGEIMPLDLKVGQKVIFQKYAGVEVEYQDEEYVIVHDRDIIAVLED